MQTLEIRFTNVSQMNDFIRIVDKFEGRATFSSRADGINAKSLIGVYSLTPNRSHRLYLQSDNPLYAKQLAAYRVDSAAVPGFR